MLIYHLKEKVGLKNSLNNMTENILIYKIAFWAKRFKLGEIYLKRDNKTKYMGYISMYEGKPIFCYNMKYVNESKRYTEAFIFHELGHIINKTYLWKKVKKIDKIRSEYLAEKFCYEMTEKYFPNELERMTKQIFNLVYRKDWQKRFPIHTTAFTKLYLEKTGHKDAILYSRYSF